MSNTRKELGKISSVSFGFGGYQECMFGLTLNFSSGPFAVSDFISGGWGTQISSKGANWTESDRDDELSRMGRKIQEILTAAKVNDVNKLKGVPVEITYEGNRLKDFRILKEVL